MRSAFAADFGSAWGLLRTGPSWGQDKPILPPASVAPLPQPPLFFLSLSLFHLDSRR